MDKRSERSELETYYRGTDKATHLFVFDPNSNDADKDGVVPAKGFREVGVVVVPYTMKQSLTDDMDTANVSAVCIDSIYNVPIYDDDGSEGMVRHCELPLPERCKIHTESPAERAGSIMRLQIYGDAGNFLTENYTFRKKRDDGTIETTDVALPLNYRNYIVSYSSSKHKCYEYYYYNCERNKLTTHRYTLVGLITYLQNFPVRSTKTFAEGRYTWRRILEICFELFFHPRYGSAFKIYGDETLDALNNRKAYTNATLYDVVRDISQQLDRVPKLELKVSPGGSCTYQLMLFPKTGAGFGTTDMDFFNWEEAKVDVCALNQSAGSVISNVRSLVPDGDFTYPDNGGARPCDTNLSNSWRTFKTPTAIKHIKEIRIYPEKEVVNYKDGDRTYLTRICHIDWIKGGSVIGNVETFEKETKRLGDKFNYERYFSLTEGNYFICRTKNDNNTPVNCYLYEHEDYQYLPKDTGDSESGLTQPSQDKSIWYKKGGDEIHLDCLYDKEFMTGDQGYMGTAAMALYSITDVKDSNSVSASRHYVFRFRDSVDDNIPDKEVVSEYQIAVTYSPIIEDAVLKGSNNLDGDITVLYNQLGEQVSATGFMDNLNSYAGDMEERSLQRGKVISIDDNSPYAFSNMWNGVPRVGSNVYDAKTNKQYVITELDYNVLNVKAEIIATLDEKSAGVAKSIRPNSGIELGVLSLNETVKSNTNIEFRIRIGLTPQKGSELGFLLTQSSNAERVLAGITGYNVGKTNIKYLALLKGDENITSLKGKGEGVFFPVISGLYRNGIYFITGFTHNKVAGFYDGEPVFYTDTDGYLPSMGLFYLHSFGAVESLLIGKSFPKLTSADVSRLFGPIRSSYVGFAVVDSREYPFEIYKDRHEITGITTQITFNGADGILLSPTVPLRTAFAEPKRSDMSVVLLSREVSVDNDMWRSYVIDKYPVNEISANYTKRYITYTVAKDLPAHRAWSIIDSDNELRLLSNTKLPVDADGKFVLYYGIEKITL